MPLTNGQREVIRVEAVSWAKAHTPYRGHTCKKGVGADCGQILYGVYHGLGLLPEIVLPRDYSLEVASHRASTDYVDLVTQYMRPIQELEAQVGDVVAYKVDLAFAHAGIIVAIRSPHDFDVVDAQLHGGVRVRHGYDQPKFKRASKRYFTLKDEFSGHPVKVDKLPTEIDRKPPALKQELEYQNQKFHEEEKKTPSYYARGLDILRTILGKKKEVRKDATVVLKPLSLGGKTNI
jgi:hypothetical protein